MNLFSDIRSLVLTSLEALQSNGTLPKELDFSNVTVEPPRDSSHGDMSTNAAMVLAKPAKMNPRLIAEALCSLLENDSRKYLQMLQVLDFLIYALIRII
jgi:arginyl-tRNA synthetase